MFQYTVSDRISKNKKIADSRVLMSIKDILNPLLLKLSSSKITYNLLPINELDILNDHPIIFAVNHYCCQDTPIACNVIDRRGYVLAGKQNLKFIDEIFFNLNGTIFVDRKDKIDMKNSKKAMSYYLDNNYPLIYFPEGTWNLDDSALMLPMKWGIIDIAKKCNAQIIPIVLHYDDIKNNCYIYYEKPLVFNHCNDNLSEINNLRDKMSSAKWKFIELCSLKNYSFLDNEQIIEISKKIFNDTINVDELYRTLNLNKRSIVNINKLRNQFYHVLSEYPELDYEYEQSIIYRPNISESEVYEPIKKLYLKK